MRGRLIGYSKAWKMFKDFYNLAAYRDLPAARYEEAVRWLRAQIALAKGENRLDW